jgi:polysaccharide deacetylase family protein (PEP-CTERM system associated)
MSHTRLEDLVINALTIDFEDWYQGLEIPPSGWDRFEDRIAFAGRKILGLLAEADVRATFFVLGHVAERHPELILEIASEGHELATHGYSHTLVYLLAPDDFRAEIERCVRFLEDLTGKRVLGHRAPFFSITRDSLWALDVLAECGIVYDSSIFPVTNYRYGIPTASRWPYRIDGESGTLTEFPVSTWEIGGQRIPVAGGAYFRIYPYSVTRAAFRAINRLGREAVFYVHPWEVDPRHPRISLPRRISVLHYWNLGATEGRLRRLLRDFRFAPMGEVLGLSETSSRAA